MAVLMKSRKKRRNVCWYHLPPDRWPWCPHCRIICTANGTVTDDGMILQNRRCPQCGHRVKTVVPEDGH